MLLWRYLEATFCTLSTLIYSVISIGGIGIGGYTFIVGKVSIPWSVQILGY